jgi:ABC-type Fe3+/spermidine/putrescine transport system ATPase subunit
MMGKLEIDDVTMRFGDVVAVDRVSLTVAEGETVVLLGPSGCGKTTLLRLIAGFNRPIAGAIRIAGRTWRRRP